MKLVSAATDILGSEIGMGAEGRERGPNGALVKSRKAGERHFFRMIMMWKLKLNMQYPERKLDYSTGESGRDGGLQLSTYPFPCLMFCYK